MPGRTRQVTLNRAAFDAIDLAMADAAFELARAIVEEARVPDAPPLTQGLLEGGGVAAWFGRKKIDQATTGARSAVKKPRRAKLDPVGWLVVGGYGFPGRFVEEGTVDTPAMPFLTPSLMSHLPDAETYIRAAAVKHKIIGQQRAAAGDVYKRAVPEGEG